ncbi:MAG: hypothetical protein KDJ74_11000 [Notoacmeibacter sp.]|nr:hypothetical protein [Notoacmeibacter sp.]
MTDPKNKTPATIALTVLAIIQAVMLSTMLVQVAPHPPFVIPLFAMGPFLGASLALCAAAIMAGAEQGRAGKVLSGLAVLAALISFGPQKYFDAAFPQIWPAVVTAQLACMVIAMRVVPGLDLRAGSFRREAL